MTDNNKKFIIFDKAFTISIICFSIIIGIICLFPLILTTSAFNYRLDFSKTGQIGDTIGGTMGPFIAIAAAILTFIAFWVQYKSNARINFMNF